MARPRIKRTERVSSSNYRERQILKKANAAECKMPSKIRNINDIFTETDKLKEK